MGCNSSKLDDEEAVQLCKDRKMFIKQAVEHRIRFVSSHAAYIQSLRRFSAALHGYIEGDELREVLLDSYMGRSFTPVKKSGPRFITVSPKCFIETQSESKTSVRISYYQPSGNPVISVEERLQSPETVQIQSYTPSLDCSIDGFLTMQPPSLDTAYSPYNRPNIPPPSPQNNQWDFFWDPFSQLDYYGYPTSNLDRSVSGLRQVLEGVHGLEEEIGQKDTDASHVKEERIESSQNPREEEVIAVDVDEDKENHMIREHEVNGTQATGNKNIELTQASEAQKLEFHPPETSVGEHERTEETPGFTAYANRRPTNMEEVLKDLETQFTNVCNSAKEVFTLLESSHTKYLPSSQDTSPLKMLNPVALFRSGSSHFSRLLDSSLGSRDESYESSTLCGSHQSTLDRLYAWEKRLHEEVRSAERVRHAYEKKCKQLINRDVEGEDPSFVERTKSTIRDLHTQMKVAMHSIKTISMRIETLRDDELRPQLLELLQGLVEMWKVMAECHQTQRHAIDDAKLLLADGTPSKLSKSGQAGTTPGTTTDPNRLAHSASILETELRNWKACFESWITSQRSYVHCLSNWLLRCMRCEPASKPPPFSPEDSVASNAAPPIFGICLHWSKFLDKVSEAAVLDGLEFFAAGMQSIYAQQTRANSQRLQQGGGIGSESFSKNVDATEYGVGGREEEAMEAEKMKELSTRVLCAGMSAAMSSLADFAMESAEGYAEVVNQWENVKWPPPLNSGAALSD